MVLTPQLRQRIEMLQMTSMELNELCLFTHLTLPTILLV
jgi:DNA-directed RNA polymerase specialized sigma54-like protein